MKHVLVYVSFTAHLGITLLNNQTNMFISILNMFRAAMCSSSGESILTMLYLVSLCVGDRLVCRLGWNQTCIPDGHPHSLTCTRYRIDTNGSPDDEHMAARNMQRIEINIYKKLDVNLVI